MHVFVHVIEGEGWGRASPANLLCFLWCLRGFFWVGGRCEKESIRLPESWHFSLFLSLSPSLRATSVQYKWVAHGRGWNSRAAFESQTQMAWKTCSMMLWRLFPQLHCWVTDCPAVAENLPAFKCSFHRLMVEVCGCDTELWKIAKIKDANEHCPRDHVDTL